MGAIDFKPSFSIFDPPIPQNEFFPTTDSTGKVVLFHVYVDTYLLITEGAQKEGVIVTESTEDIDFIMSKIFCSLR